MAETPTSRRQQLQGQLLPWQQPHDLLLQVVLHRVTELEALGGRWPSLAVATKGETR